MPVNPVNKKPAPRPNILLILADDMGFSDIGCYGGEIQTPNLNRLARDGLRFSQMYNFARCCPSRAALLTGVYPHQAGIGHMIQNLGTPAYQGYLRDDCLTLGEALRPAGYRTCLSGKWHVGGFWHRRPQDAHLWTTGDPTRPLPTDRGFDRFYGNPAGGGSYFNPRPLFDQDHIIEPWPGFYNTDVYTDAAIGMIEESVRDGMPFFLHLCYNAPHWPLHALPEDIARYQGKYTRGWDAVRTARHEEMKGMGLVDPRWPISKRDEQAPPWVETREKDWEDARMAVYAAQVDRMDQNIGRLMLRLEELGIADSTLILFLSDNGGCAEFLSENGQREKEWPVTVEGAAVRLGNRTEIEPGPADTFMSYDLPWANASNSPFRLFKHYVHEGGIATPLIARWPAQIAPGGVAHEPGLVIDIAATILDVAGAIYPLEHNGKAITPLEGESFASLFTGQTWRRSQPLFWEHEGNRAVRQENWKLVTRYPGTWELYDMERDRTEQEDLAGRYPDLVQQMDRQYLKWAERCGVLPWDVIWKAHRA